MPRKRVTAEQRRAVVERSGESCEYCLSQLRFSMQSFSVEHIIPVEKGGETELENLGLSCQGCNNHKYNKILGHDPVSRKTVPLYHPRQQNWMDHFIWNEDFTQIVGTTPTGRATVRELKVNRVGLVNLRRVLYQTSKHPPGWGKS